MPRDPAPDVSLLSEFTAQETQQRGLGEKQRRKRGKRRSTEGAARNGLEELDMLWDNERLYAKTAHSFSFL